ncbi:MAG TPA: M20 family metallopeptidase, partial [Thermomicrobiales bacterium]|nr:M20 family metallopeptidase [Thermomicrobiales bacterium]
KVLAQINEDEVVAFLRKIVQTPTVNPPGDVRAAIQICADTLDAVGFRTRTVSLVPTKPNLLAELGQEGPTLCFNAHLDVVPTGERSAWKHDPFGADVADGRVYGRGAGDDKASVTAQVMAGVAVARSGIPLRGTLVVNEVADEEIGGPNGAALVVNEGHVKPDFVIVGEQTMNRVCIGEKGAAATRVTVTGKAAHGALPWEGANAIEAMAAIIHALRTELFPQLAKRTHPLFHPSSASVNMMTGGVKENVVPDLCSVYIDRRVVPGEDPKECVAEIKAVAEQAIADFPGVTVDVQPATQGRPAILADPASPLVQGMTAANRYLGLNPEPSGFSMATDGRFFVAAGYPTIIYGPGDPKIAHIADEWVGIDEVMEATRAYALAAVALIGAQGND